MSDENVSDFVKQYVRNVRGRTADLNAISAARNANRSSGSISDALMRGELFRNQGVAPPNQALDSEPGVFDRLMHVLSVPANMVQASTRYFNEGDEGVSKAKAYNAGAVGTGGDFASTRSEEAAAPKYSSLGQALGAANTIGETAGDLDFNLRNAGVIDDNTSGFGKGAATFAASLAMDPLMYVPGAAYGAAFRSPVTATRSLTAGGREINAAAKAIRKAKVSARKDAVALSRAEKRNVKRSGSVDDSTLTGLRVAAEQSSVRLSEAREAMSRLRNPDQAPLDSVDDLLSQSEVLSGQSYLDNWKSNNPNRNAVELPPEMAVPSINGIRESSSLVDNLHSIQVRDAQSAFDDLMRQAPADLSAGEKTLRTSLQGMAKRRSLTAKDGLMFDHLRQFVKAREADGVVVTKGMLDRERTVFNSANKLDETIAGRTVPVSNRAQLADNVDEVIERQAATELGRQPLPTHEDILSAVTPVRSVADEAALRVNVVDDIINEATVDNSLGRAIPMRDSVMDVTDTFKNHVIPTLHGLENEARLAAGTSARNARLDKIKEVQLSRGQYVVAAAPGSDNVYNLWPNDVIKIVDENVDFVGRYHSVARNEPTARGIKGKPDDFARVMSNDTYQVGAATALDLRAVGGIDDADAIAQIREVMRKHDKTGRPTKANVAEAVATALWNSREQLADVAATNAARIAKKDARDAAQLASQATATIDNAIADTVGTTNSAVDDAIKSIGEKIEDAARMSGASEAAAKEAAVKAIDDLIDKHGYTAQMISMIDTRASILGQRIKSGFGLRPQMAINRQLLMEARGADAAAARQIAESVSPEIITKFDDPIDIAVRAQGEIDHGIAFSIRNLFRRIRGENPAQSLRQSYVSTKNSGIRAHEDYARQLSVASKEVNPETAKEIHAAIMSGVRPADPATAVMFDKYRGLWDDFMEVAPIGTVANKSRGAGPVFDRGIDFNVFNKHLKARGLPQFTSNEARMNTLRKEMSAAQRQYDAAKAAGTLTPEMSAKMDAIRKNFDHEAAFGIPDQIRSWSTPEDPFEFLSKLASASMDAITGQRVAMSFAKEFGASVKYKPGYRQVVRGPENAEKNLITDHLVGLYLPQDSINHLARAERHLAKARDFSKSTSAMGRFINNYYDPILGGMKAWMTVANPGHHLRNAYGEVAITGIDLGWKGLRVKNYRDGMEVMRAGGQIDKTPGAVMDQFLGKVDSIQGEGKVLRTVALAGGKTVNLTAADVFRLMDQAGMFPSYRVLEDLTGATAGGVGKYIDKMTDNPVIRAGGVVSEKSSYYARIAHTLGILADPKITHHAKSIDELMGTTRMRVLQHHPDPQGLAAWEQKYMRRIFPFYSWVRGIIPTMAISMMSKPHRVTALPKATYSMLIAQGVNPATIDVGDQFPDDKLYPKFIQEGIVGPIFGGDTTMNFGSPVEAMADMFNGNIARNVLGMTSFVPKAGVELMSGTSISTGAHVQDRGEIIDSLLPFYGAQASRITGISPSGTISNMLSGNFENGILDPQRAVQQGEKTAFANNATANFLTGLGFQNVEKDSYRNIAARGGWQ